jgi:hypothetical protein
MEKEQSARMVVGNHAWVKCSRTWWEKDSKGLWKEKKETYWKRVPREKKND